MMNKEKNKYVILFLIAWSALSHSAFASQDVKKFLMNLFTDAPAAQPASGAGPGQEIEKEGAEPVASAAKPPKKPQKPFLYVDHALGIILNISDVMRNSDGGHSAPLVALDVIAQSAKRNLPKFNVGHTRVVLQSYEHLFSPHDMPQEARVCIAQEMANGDPFKRYKQEIAQADPALNDIEKALAQANAAQRHAQPVKKTPVTPKPFPYLRHMFVVLRKLNSIGQHMQLKAGPKETILLALEDKLDDLAQTPARPTLEAYDHLFSGKKLAAPIKKMVAQELARGNPLIVHKQSILSVNKSLKEAFEELEKEEKNKKE